MYLDHFGLNDLPFRLTPDTSYFFNAGGHQEALNVLLVALRSGEGFIKVTGEVGTGKTLLCRMLLNSLEDDAYCTAYIPNPLLTPAALVMALADELGLKVPRNQGWYRLLKVINEQLVELVREGRTTVLLLDEAQAMPRESLEALRLLSNLETEKKKLLQVVMFGQPELDVQLQKPSLRQLRQRIAFSYLLPAMDRKAMEAYLAHRFYIAGFRGPLPFSKKALDGLFRASRGVPRLINILAHKSLMAAYGAGAKEVGHKQVRAAVEDTDDTQGALKPCWLRRIWALAGATAFAAVGLVALMTGGGL
ncbi:MAG: AAA family ATPase [Gammaproteobacteria bacterium]